MSVFSNKPTSSGFPQLPPQSLSRVTSNTEARVVALPELEAHARLIQANLDALTQLSEFAKKMIFEDIATKMKELALKEALVAEIDRKEKQANELHQRLLDDEKQLNVERATFREDFRKSRESIQDERIAQLQEKIQYALPKFLSTEDSKPVLVRLQPAFDSGSEGKQLQIFFAAAAIAEETKDLELYKMALGKLFPLIRDIDSKLGAVAGSLVVDITTQINKGNELGCELRAPKKGELVIESWMNAPVGLKVVNEVFCWAITQKEKGIIRKADVK